MLSDKRAAGLAVTVAIIGLFIIPILVIPTMVIAGWKWESGPRWARGTLVVVAIVFVAYLVMAKPAPAHH
jgi:hypothetical protein